MIHIMTATEFDDPNASDDEGEELREGEVDPSWDVDDPPDYAEHEADD
jgi:hypothetical protein